MNSYFGSKNYTVLVIDQPWFNRAMPMVYIMFQNILHQVNPSVTACQYRQRVQFAERVNPEDANVLHLRYEHTNPKHDECQFFTDSTVVAETSGTDADMFQCLLLEVQPQDTGLTEIRPVMVTKQLRVTTSDDLQATRITFLLPKNSAFKARARRITLEGSFFGADLLEYLDAEV